MEDKWTNLRSYSYPREYMSKHVNNKLARECTALRKILTVMLLTDARLVNKMPGMRRMENKY